MAIASCVVDTNILLRMTRRADPQHQLIATALTHLISQGATLHYTHQNIAELWNVMTRPLVRNGLGLTLNVPDFSRFGGLAPVHPNQL
jgi:predicted nucleic acid-binding protein